MGLGRSRCAGVYRPYCSRGSTFYTCKIGAIRVDTSGYNDCVYKANYPAFPWFTGTTESHPPDDYWDISPKDDFNYGAAIAGGLFGGVFCCGCVVAVFLSCRNRKREGQVPDVNDGHEIQRANTMVAGAIDTPMADSILRLPTATETLSPI